MSRVHAPSRNFGDSRLAAAIVFAALIVLAARLSGASGNASDMPRKNPDQLIRDVVANELKTGTDSNDLWRYRETLRTGNATEEFEYVETPNGSLHRLLRRDGRPLSPEEARKEDERIRKMVAAPGMFEKHARNEEQDSNEARELLTMLPEAFQYRYLTRQNNLIELGFTPRPSFRPRRHEGAVFHDMEGVVWIDPGERRIAGMEGRLVNEVKFGGGILGHLEKGGTFVLHRRDVGNGHWETTLLDVNMDGKALFFKTISVRHHEEDSDFQPVDPGISLQEASNLLKKDAAIAGGAGPSSLRR